MWLDEFFAKHKHSEVYGYLRDRLVCKDGFSMSVQASDSHYCYPRETGLDHYNCVEVGDPDTPEQTLMEFENGGVYGSVPAQVVNDIIEKHGGLEDE